MTSSHANSPEDYGSEDFREFGGQFMQCFSCLRQKVTMVHRSKVGEVYRCKSCTAIFSRIYLDTTQLYDESYFMTYYTGIEDKQRANSQNFLSIIKRFKSSGSILDYGCGTGIFLQVASDCGFIDNVGVDVSQAALKVARNNISPKDKLVWSTYESLPNRKFDIISFIDSLSTIPDISNLLRNLIHSNLKADGVLFIRTPNINQLYYTYVKALSVILPEKHISTYYFIPKRFCLMNQRAIQAFLHSFGLEVKYLAFQLDYSIDIPTRSLREHIVRLMYKTIPKWINPYNSMIVIAQRKRD